LLSFLQNIRFLLWKVHTIHSGFTIWQRAWKRSRKGESAVLPVTGCGFPRLRLMQKRTDLISLTLSISPLKNAEKLNQIGAELADTFGVRYLFSDFKKKEGYKKSTEISKEYHMYRQYYCGCVYSKRDRDREIVLRRQQEEQIL